MWNLFVVKYFIPWSLQWTKNITFSFIVKNILCVQFSSCHTSDEKFLMLIFPKLRYAPNFYIFLFQISLKISSLCSILFFSCLWFIIILHLQVNYFTLLATYKTFPRSIQSLSVSWSTYIFPITNFHCIYIAQYQKKRWAYFAIFLTYISFWQFFYSSLLYSIFYSKFQYFAQSLAV